MEKARKGNRKWTVHETLLILEYVKEHTNLERPTAQVYYTKCLEKTKINSPWNLLRWKMRYLRTTFKKAEDWKRSKEAKQLETFEGISSVKEKLHKICPHYNILRDIFGPVKKNKINYDSETRSSSISPPPMSKVASDSFTENDYTATDDDFSQLKEEPQDWNSYEMSTLPAESFKRTTSSAEQENFTERLEKESSIDHLATIQREMNEIQKLKIRLEDKKHEKEIELKEKKLKLEEMEVLEKIARRKQEMEIRQQEIDLKKMEMDKEERLRRLEIEKEERLEKYEIEMRYRYAN